jgi:hypothetical protein
MEVDLAHAGFLMCPQNVFTGVGLFPAGVMNSPLKCNLICGPNYLGLPGLKPMVQRFYDTDKWYRNNIDTKEFRVEQILRETIQKHYPLTWSDKLDLILVDFKQVVKNLETLEEHYEYELLHEFGEEFDLTPETTYSKTVLIRLYELLKYTELEHTKTLAWMIIDQHLLFIYALKKTNDMEANMIKGTFPVWNRCAWYGQLPDLSHQLLTQAGIFRTRYIPDDGMLSALVRFFLCKTQIHKCQGRNLSDMLLKSAHTYPQLATLMIETVYYILLGNYPRTKVVPGIKERVHVTTYFTYLVSQEYPQQFQWIKDHGKLVYFAARIYMLWNLEKVPTLHRLLLSQMNFYPFTKILDEAMDAARQAYFYEGMSLYEISRGELDDNKGLLQTYHVEINKLFIKLRKWSPLEKFSADILSVSDKLWMGEKEGLQHFIDKLKSCQGKAPKDYPATLKRYLKINPNMREIELFKITPDHRACIYSLADVAAENVHGWFHPEFLLQLGCSYPFVNDLLEHFKQYDALDVSDNSLPKGIETFYHQYPREFIIANEFLQRIMFVQEIRIELLPRHVLEAQYSRLRNRYELMDTEPLPEHTHMLYYCRECQSIYSPILDPTLLSCQRSAAIGLQAGHNGALNDLQRGIIICRNYYKNPGCNRALEKFDLLGKTVSTKTKRLQMCSNCASITIYDLLRMQTNGIACNCETRVNACAIMVEESVDAVRPVNADITAPCEYCKSVFVQKDGVMINIYCGGKDTLTRTGWMCKDHFEMIRYYWKYKRLKQSTPIPYYLIQAYCNTTVKFKGKTSGHKTWREILTKEIHTETRNHDLLQIKQ